MEPNEYLHQAFLLDVQIHANRQELERLQKLFQPPISKPLLVKVIAYRACIEAEIDRCHSLKDEIQNIIAAIEDYRQRQLFYKRYIECKTWELIAEEMNCSFQYCHVLHRKALQKLRIGVVIKNA